jgi:hypothetical protein
MTALNELSVKETVETSDQVLIYDMTNGQPRRASAASVASFVASQLDNTLEPVQLASYTIAELPPASENPYSVVFCLNGNAGSPCVAVSNGVAWKVVALGATVS